MSHLGGDAQDRGWGPGWPNCQESKIVDLTVNGVSFPGGVRAELKELCTLLLEETERRGYNLVKGWCWGFACRAISGSSTPSNHSWGLALDINAPKNPYGSTLVTDMPAWMPELWARYGFRWGGAYSGVKDAMHYEFMGTPAEAAALTEQARNELVPGFRYRIRNKGAKNWSERLKLRKAAKRAGKRVKANGGKPYEIYKRGSSKIYTRPTLRGAKSFLRKKLKKAKLGHVWRIQSKPSGFYVAVKKEAK